MIRCIAVDDSPLALDLLENYISQVKDLSLERKCTNAIEAADVLSKKEIDLIFLDIQMPDITGIDMLKALQIRPKVIFTTAYPDYAVEGFNLDASDYLLKPFSFERFEKAVNKVRAQLEAERSHDAQEREQNYIYIRSGYDTIKLSLDDILYVEAMKDYVRYVTKQQKVLALKSMKEVAAELPEDQFIRVHRSFIVPRAKISRVSPQKIFVDTYEIPIGESFRPAFFEWFNRKNRK